MIRYSLIAFLALLVGCASTNNEPVVTEPIINEPVVTNNIGGTCLHKYDSGRNFQYIGPIKSYKQLLFGQMTWVFEHTTPNGQKVYLSETEVVNYRCERRQIINTSIQ